MAESSRAQVVEAIRPMKYPPPESTKSLWTRRLIVLSFWALALCLGVPMWWRTTMVYRANLPLELMKRWSTGQVCSPSFPLRIAVDTSTLSNSDANQFLKAVQSAADTSNRSPTHVFELSSSNSKSSESSAALKVELRTPWGASTPQASIQPHTNVIRISYGKSTPTEEVAAYVAEQLKTVYAEETAIFAQLVSGTSDQGKINELPSDVAESVRRRESRVFKYASTYHLTFSLFTPEAQPSSWDIEKALQKNFAPLLEALSSVGNFSIETQVQTFATFTSSVQPKYKEEEKIWRLKREELGGFINAAEWPLSPSIGSGPTINFVLYVSSTHQSPLMVESSTSNSWLVPQWGIIAIHNPKRKSGTSNPKVLTDADLQPALVSFSNQFLSLIGLPMTPRESFPLQLATLTRVRAASLFLSASSTLGSLARLVEQLPSISIPDSVAENVEATIRNLDQACANFKAGEFQQALKHAGDAEAQAEKAFFEKSMVGQVYFPDEHKVAVYLPLLGPVAVPLLVAGLAEIKPFIQKLRRRRP